MDGKLEEIQAVQERTNKRIEAVCDIILNHCRETEKRLIAIEEQVNALSNNE